MPESADADITEQVAHILALPLKVREASYSFCTAPDLEIYADEMQKSALLQVSKQIGQECSDVFFSSSSLQREVYTGLSNPTSWEHIQDSHVKREVFLHGEMLDLLDFWSIGSARQYCQSVYNEWQGNVQMGVMTIFTGGGLKRWPWSMALGDGGRCVPLNTTNVRCGSLRYFWCRS